MQEDYCTPLVKHGLYDYVQKLNSNYNEARAKQEICEKYNEINKSGTGISASAQYSLFSGSASYSQDQLKAIGRVMCESRYSDNTAKQDETYLTQTLSDKALQAWNSCVALSGIGLKVRTFIAEDEMRVTVEVKCVFTGDSGAQTIDSITTDQGTFPDENCTGGLWKLRNGGKLPFNRVMALTCRRQQFTTAQTIDGWAVIAPAGSIVIGTAAGTVTSYVSEVRKPPPPPSTTDVVMQAFPSGAVLAFAKDVPIPEGWAACDGQQGRPDLKGRFPLGYIDKNKIGKIGGGEAHFHQLNASNGAGAGGTVQGTSWGMALGSSQVPDAPAGPVGTSAGAVFKERETGPGFSGPPYVLQSSEHPLLPPYMNVLFICKR